MLYAGTAREIITPPLGTPLAGFGHRDHGAESVLDDLEVRAIWLQNDDPTERPICIVCADLIGFDEVLASNIRDAVNHACALPHANLLLAASHTHSGPQTCENMHAVGVYVPRVVDEIALKIVHTVLAAAANLIPVELTYGEGRCEGYAVNRRLLKDGKAIFAPNPAGIRDDTVNVISLVSSLTHHVVAVLFRYACHPTTMGDYRITADYPGVARRRIESALGEHAVAAFLPACFADIRPNCTYMGGNAFRRGQPEDIQAFGNAIGDAVLQTMDSTSMMPLSASLYASTSSVELPLDQKSLSSASSVRKLQLQRIDLAHNLTLITMGGEICCGYSNLIKQIDSSKVIVPVGYSNGLIGYIPTASMFSEGGYEVLDSGAYFNLPSPFKASIEDYILAGVRELLYAPR